jgi:deazaflavin-dependent oxidoreductase (nitroreductase family)
MPKTYRITPIVKIVNFLSGALVRLQMGPKARVLLTVKGRKTGHLYTTPVTLVNHNGKTYLVAPYGEVSWVRNARASGRVTLERGRQQCDVAITEIPLPDRPLILQKYLRLEPITQPYFKSGRDSPTEAFTSDAAGHPVFLVQDLSET